MLKDDLSVDWLTPWADEWTSSSTLMRGEEFDSREEATDGEGDELDEDEDGEEEPEEAQDEDSDCLQASLVLLLCFRLFDFYK